MKTFLQENKKLLQRIDKTLQQMRKDRKKDKKSDSKWTPALARAYGMRIDQKIKSLGRSGVSKQTPEEKLDKIIKMLMALGSGQLMNLAVSQKGGLLAKAALAKGLVTEDKLPGLSGLFTQHLLIPEQPFLSFNNFTQINDLYEKLFDGSFDKKTEQAEALEFLQSVNKIVDGEKIYRDEITLRNDVYALIQRPMTSISTGYIIVQVTDDGSNNISQDNEVTINPVVEGLIHGKEVKSKVIKNYSGPKSFTSSSTITISPIDCLGLSEDNKRFFLVYDLTDGQKMKRGMIEPDEFEDDEIDSKKDDDKEQEELKKIIKKAEKTLKKGLKKEEVLLEKSLSNSEIQSLIDSIKKKLNPRRDEKARGMLKLTKEIEKTFKNRKSLHPNSVVTIMRMATSVGGKWGKNSKDWDGSPPSGELNKYPPSPTEYSS